jgi:hypothetical protein
LQRPNLYRIGWTQATDYFTNGGAAWSSGNNSYVQIRPWRKPEVERDMKSALSTAAGVSGTASSTLPPVFFNQNWNNVLNSGNVTLEPAEVVDGVDCYVVSSSKGPASGQGNTGRKTTTTVWISKQDYLIRQVQTVIDGMAVKIPQVSDAVITKILQQENVVVTPEAMAAKRAELQNVNKQVEQNAMKSGFDFIQTHRNIVVNQKFSATDFENAE